jgi:hypothetical protein
LNLPITTRMVMFEVKQLTETDRRAHPRVRIARPGKLLDPRSGKYISCSTRDLSAGGVLIEIDQPIEIAPGEQMFLGIAQKRRQMFIRTEEMLRMTVVRALGTPGGGTAIAGQWVQGACDAAELRLAA